MREPNLQKNPQLAENLMKAVIEGAAFSLSMAQKPSTLKILQKYLRITEKDAEEGYRDLVSGTDKKPYAAPEGVNNVVRLMKRSNPKVEKVKPEQLIEQVKTSHCFVAFVRSRIVLVTTCSCSSAIRDHVFHRHDQEDSAPSIFILSCSQVQITQE
jgi:uncharacterized protein YneF (UPF0154 family)